MKRFVICALLSATLALALAPGASARGKFKFFQTPSGNIACAMGGGAVRCDILEHGWTAPPKPSWCDVDWGSGAQVGRKGKGSFVCAGDTVFAPDNPVLSYGDRLTKNRFRCASKQKGVRCVNRRDKHGFFLSRQSVKLF